MRSRFFARNSAGVDVGAPNDPSHESDENENVPGIVDLFPTEFTDEHIVLRESLIRHFAVRYQRGEVRWLQYPDRKKFAMY
jgi:hypothetical protein